MSCQFVKFMGQDFSQMLAFPMNLMMNFKQLAEVITLEGPSGNQWSVRFSYIGDHIYLNEGWKEFVKANYVEEGDCLAFEYCGSSCFSVLIFDRSGCEREASHFARIMNPIPAKGCQAEEKRDNQVPDVLRFSSPRLPCVDNSPMQLVSNYEKSSAFNVKFDRRRFGLRSSAHNDEKNYEHAIQSKMVEERSAMCSSVNMQKEQTAAIKLKAKLKYLLNTKAICAKTPYFTKFLLPSHLSGTSAFMIYILQIFPSDFAVKHLRLRPQKIFLRHQDKMWSVKYKFEVASNGGSVTGLSGKGWRRIVEDNALCEGDGCIFVLSESEKEMVLDVHIVRVDD